MSKKSKPYSCFLISNKPNLVKEVTKNLKKETVTYFDGTNVSSFSKLVNSCVLQAPSETVIIMSDKMRPTDENIQRTLDLLDEGYAFVGLYRFGFFGFKKQLFRKVGPLDERFVGGCFEDDDFYLRMCEANLGIYLSQEVKYIKSASSWNHTLSKKHFFEKWKFNDIEKKVIRKINEQQHNYQFGKEVPTNFLEWRQSKFLAKKIKRYQGVEIGYE